MNQATRTKIERFTLAKLTELFGPPWDPENNTWIIPYGATGGTVSIQLYADRNPWLACRLSNPIFLQPDRYTRPRRELNWPHQFTYPSGKHNLHSGAKTTFEEWERDFALHLIDLTARGSMERTLAETIPFYV